MKALKRALMFLERLLFNVGEPFMIVLKALQKLLRGAGAAGSNVLFATGCTVRHSAFGGRPLRWGALGLNQLFKRRESNLCTDDHRKKPGKRRFARSSPVSRLWDVGFWRARWPPIRPNIAAQLYVSAVEQAVCVGISMGVNSLLLAVLVHYLLVLRMHPNDDDNPSRELLRLRKELRVPHCI